MSLAFFARQTSAGRRSELRLRFWEVDGSGFGCEKALSVSQIESSTSSPP